MMRVFLYTLIFVHFFPTILWADFKLIYGEDNRHEVSASELSELSSAVAAKIHLNQLGEPAKSLQQQHNLCPDEDQRFNQQPVKASCSGVLIAPDLLLTAGHCMVTPKDCSDYIWAFDWRVEDGEQLHHIARCDRVLAQQWFPGKDQALDYALIKLKNVPSVATTVTLRRRFHVGLKAPLIMLGHPLGLPMKASDNATVTPLDGNRIGLFSSSYDLLRRIFTKQTYYNTNLDSFAGNSGSPVFNANTHVVEGILIGGGDDFEWDQVNQCRRYRRASRQHLSSKEKVLRPNAIPDIWQHIEMSLDRSLN